MAFTSGWNGVRNMYGYNTRNSTHNERRAAGQGYNEQPDQYQGQELYQPIRPESSMSNYHPDTNFMYGNNPFPVMASAQRAAGYGFSFGPPSFAHSPMTEASPPMTNLSGAGGMAYATTFDAGNAMAVSAGGDFDMDTVSSGSDSASLASLIRSGGASHEDPDLHRLNKTNTSRRQTHTQHHRRHGGARASNNNYQQGHPHHRPEVRNWLSRSMVGMPTNFAPIPRNPVYNMPLPPWATMPGGRPTFEQAMQTFPFDNPLEGRAPHNAGVLKIVNIPYNSTKNELLAAIGSKAQVVAQPAGSPFFAVHVIMERNSGKTMDAYIEVSSPGEAFNIATTFNRRSEQGRQLKVGDRVVEIQASNQDELLRDLFPCAKNVNWVGHDPYIFQETNMYYANVPAQGFNGFVGSEEMVILAKFAETPARSPFAIKCPNRVYECMISILHKYPWHKPSVSPLSDRRKIFECAIACVRSLAQSLRRSNNHPNLTEALLQELAVATLGCPGLSEQQKSHIVGVMQREDYGYIADGAGMRVTLGGQARTAHFWPFLIIRKAWFSDPALVDIYIDFIVEAAVGNGAHATTNEGATGPWSTASSDTATSGSMGRTQRFGGIVVDYRANDMGRLTLAEVASIELEAIKNLLYQVLPTAYPRTNRRLTLD